MLCSILAGVVGIEPTLTVLETGVLPLYDTPSALCYYYINNLNNHLFLLIFLRVY